MKTFFGQKIFWECLLIVLIITVLSALAINYFLLRLDITIRSTTPYYLLSSIIQGFLALVGILGAVTIFQLQETRERRRIASHERDDNETNCLFTDEYWIRWRMMFLSFLVIVDVFFAMVLMLLVKEGELQTSWFVWAINAIVGFSIAILGYALWVVRKHFTGARCLRKRLEESIKTPQRTTLIHMILERNLLVRRTDPHKIAL